MREKRTTADRFWAKVDKGDGAGCWVWTASRKHTGYGFFGYQGRNMIASRVSWIMAFGPIPAGLHVLHECDNPSCVRPNHLFLGTQADNMRDMARKGRSLTGDANPMRKHPELGIHGSAHPKAKLTEDAVRVIRADYRAGGITHKELGERFGVHSKTIAMVLRGKWWKHVV